MKEPDAWLCAHDAAAAFRDAKRFTLNAVWAGAGMSCSPYDREFWLEIAATALRWAIRLRDRDLPPRWRRGES